MANSMGQDERSSAEKAGAAMAWMADPGQIARNLEPFFQASSRLIENWRAATEELLEFGKQRLTHGIETSRRVARSGSFDEAIEAHAEFARGCMQDYINETGKLAEIGTRAISESLEAWRRESQAAAEGVRDLAARTEDAVSDAAQTMRDRKYAAE